jgi:hypothetical protein
MATLGAQKSGHCKQVLTPLEGFQSKLILKLVRPDFFWPLLADGRYLELAVNTGILKFTIKQTISIHAFGSLGEKLIRLGEVR